MLRALLLGERTAKQDWGRGQQGEPGEGTEMMVGQEGVAGCETAEHCDMTWKQKIKTFKGQGKQWVTSNDPNSLQLLWHLYHCSEIPSMSVFWWLFREPPYCNDLLSYIQTPCWLLSVGVFAVSYCISVWALVCECSRWPSGWSAYSRGNTAALSISMHWHLCCLMHSFSLLMPNLW